MTIAHWPSASGANKNINLGSGSIATVLDSDALAHVFQPENIPISHEVVIDEDLQINDSERDTLQTDKANNVHTVNTPYVGDELNNTETVVVLGLQDIHVMFTVLNTSRNTLNKWMNKNIDNFLDILKDSVLLKSEMTKNELVICLESVKTKLAVSNIRFSKSWNKQKLADFLKALNAKQEDMVTKP